MDEPRRYAAESIPSPMTTLPAPVTCLLAQDTTAASGQLFYAFEQFFTPAGISIAILGLILAVTAFRLGKAIALFSGIALFCVAFQLHPDALTLNILLGPLQTFRYLSKSIAFLLLTLAVLAVYSTPGPARPKAAGFAAASFLAFQIYYDLQLMAFASEGGLKGLFGLASMSFMFLVYAVGYGRLAFDPSSALRTMAVFSYVGIAFVLVNVVQILAGLSGAMVAGRLAGISGNAQMMGGISSMLLLVNAYVFVSSTNRSLARWLSLACIGILPVFILWTGSRTAVLATALGLFLMFRLQFGRLALFALAGGIVFVIAATVLQSENVVSERFETGVDTRGAGWTGAFLTFLGSPVFGEFPFLRAGDVPNGIESTWLRALANMGVLGGVLVAIPFVAMAVNAVRALRLGRADREYRKLCDFYIGSVAAVLVLNTLDGYAFGYLTFPVLFMYVIFMLGGLIAERSAELGTVAEYGMDPQLSGY